MKRQVRIPKSSNAEIFYSGEREVLVIDGLFSKALVNDTYAVLSKLQYGLKDSDSDEKSYSRHWIREINKDKVEDYEVLATIAAVVKASYPKESFRLRRVHSNLHMYGDLQFPHRDCPPRGGVTALYYANPQWNPDWMAETVFYAPNGEARFMVAPKPGRLVIFDGRIVHRGGVPTRECFTPRISVAFKFIRCAG